MKKTKAEFHHKKAGDSSGEFFIKFNLGLMQGALRFKDFIQGISLEFGTNLEYNSGVTRYRLEQS